MTVIKKNEIYIIMIYYLSVAIGHMREMIDRFVVQKIKCVDFFFFQ